MADDSPDNTPAQTSTATQTAATQSDSTTQMETAATQSDSPSETPSRKRIHVRCSGFQINMCIQRPAVRRSTRQSVPPERYTPEVRNKHA